MKWAGKRLKQGVAKADERKTSYDLAEALYRPWNLADSPTLWGKPHKIQAKRGICFLRAYSLIELRASLAILEKA